MSEPNTQHVCMGGNLCATSCLDCQIEVSRRFAASEPNEQLTAEGRVRHYVEMRTGRRGLDPDEIHSVDIGTEKEAHLTLSDLRAVLRAFAGQQATIESLRDTNFHLEHQSGAQSLTIAERDRTIEGLRRDAQSASGALPDMVGPVSTRVRILVDTQTRDWEKISELRVELADWMGRCEQLRTALATAEAKAQMCEVGKPYSSRMQDHAHHEQLEHIRGLAVRVCTALDVGDLYAAEKRAKKLTESSSALRGQVGALERSLDIARHYAEQAQTENGELTKKLAAAEEKLKACERDLKDQMEQIKFVVKTCIDSRIQPNAVQSAYLRDGDAPGGQ